MFFPSVGMNQWHIKNVLNKYICKTYTEGEGRSAPKERKKKVPPKEKNPHKTTYRDNSEWKVRQNWVVLPGAEICKTRLKPPAHAATGNHSTGS